MKTLHLVLKREWYDKIASGEKTSEYRAWKAYWNKRFAGQETVLVPVKPYRGIWWGWNNKYDTVIFHKGYTDETMTFEIAGICLSKNYPNDLGENICWEIKLGARIK